MHDVHELGCKMSECHGSGSGKSGKEYANCNKSPYIPSCLRAEYAKVLISKHASRSS